MGEDPRCCGTGTCIIDPEGRCWCGQQWDGEKMCHAPLAPLQEQDTGDTKEQKRLKSRLMNNAFRIKACLAAS